MEVLYSFGICCDAVWICICAGMKVFQEIEMKGERVPMMLFDNFLFHGIVFRG